MQKIIATCITAWFCVLLSAPAWALQSSDVPACCRKSGKHKCAMRQAGSEVRISAVAPKCPCAGGTIAPAELTLDAAKRRNSFPTRLISAPVVVAQVEAGFRISSIRSRLKRGPPALPNA